VEDPFKAGSIAYLVILCALLLLISMISGCAQTTAARIKAYGVHAITPYGVISMGVLDYSRKAEPDDKDE
jgi:hypothetical protein